MAKGLQLKDILRQVSHHGQERNSEGDRSLNMDQCSLILERLGEDLNSFDIHSSSMMVESKTSSSSKTIKKSFNDQTEKIESMSSKSRIKPSRKIVGKPASRNASLLEDVFTKKPKAGITSFNSNQDMPLLIPEKENKLMDGFKKQKSSKKILKIDKDELPRKPELTDKNTYSPKHSGFFKKSPVHKTEVLGFPAKKEANTLESVRSSKVLPNTLLSVMKEIDSRKDKLNVDIQRASFSEALSGTANKKSSRMFSPKNLSDRKLSHKQNGNDSVHLTSDQLNKTCITDMSLDIPSSKTKDMLSSRPRLKKSRKHSTVSKQMMATKEEAPLTLNYYMKDVSECFLNPTSKKAAKLRNLYLKHIHDNWNWYHKIKNLMPSVAQERKDLSYRLFDPDMLGSSKVLIKTRVADEGLPRKYMLLFDLDETLVHCDIKTQVKQGCAGGVSISDSVNRVAF